MEQYLRVFGGLIAVLTVVAAACTVAVALAGARAVRRGEPWRSFLGRVGTRTAFAVLALGTAFATLTPAGSGDGRYLDLVPLRRALAAGMTLTTPTQVAGNLALLFWLGLLLPAVSARTGTVLRTAAVVAATSAVIEGAQYVLGLGRFSTVDDVLLNTLGGAAGAALGVHLLAPWVRRHTGAGHRAPTSGARFHDDLGSRVRPG